MLEKIITHNSGFHTDDLFSVAALQLLLGVNNVEVVRTRDPEIIKTGDYVVDVGNKYDESRNLFDHHQKGGAGEREGGVPYASFGLVWKKFGEELCGSQEVANRVDASLVQPIDARDNGVDIFEVKVENLEPYTIDDVVFAFRPSWSKEGLQYDDAFASALEIARPILEREIARARGEEKADEMIEVKYREATDKRIILIDGGTVGERAVKTLHKFKEPLYVVTPVISDVTWKVKGVLSNPPSKRVRKRLPEGWAGKRDDELTRITGVPDAVFCHNRRFMAVVESEEGALKLAKLAVDA